MDADYSFHAIHKLKVVICKNILVNNILSNNIILNIKYYVI